jgi:hypothetical protein
VCSRELLNNVGIRRVVTYGNELTCRRMLSKVWLVEMRLTCGSVLNRSRLLLICTEPVVVYRNETYVRNVKKVHTGAPL